MNILLDRIVSCLEKAKISSPRLEARLMLGKACGISADEAVLLRRELSAEEETLLEEMLEQRLAHKPLDKILGSKGFYESIPWLSRFWMYFPVPLAGVAMIIFEIEALYNHIKSFL